MPERKLGIIAGGGSLPVRLVEACHDQGRACFVVGLKGAAEGSEVKEVVDAWFSVAALGHILGALKKADCEEVVMAGHFARPDFASLKPDWKGVLLLPRVIRAASRGDDALLRCLVDVLEEEGFAVVGADTVFSGLLMPEGPLGRIAMPDDCAGDLARGIEIVEALGRVDVGQGAVVSGGLALAVEAAEGTDHMLTRVGGLRAGWTQRQGMLVKLPKPSQERRVDLPTIGVTTVEAAAAAGLAGIAVAAGATLVIDADVMALAADAAGLFVVGIPRP